MNLVIILCYIKLLFDVTEAVDCNTTYIKDKSFFDIKLLDGILTTETNVPSKARCALSCDRFDGCVSFFYNSGTKRCQLNSIVYLSTNGSEPKKGNVYYRENLECPSTPPTIANSAHTFDVNNIQTSAGTQLQYECVSGYAQKGDMVFCQINGQWSTMSCLRDCFTPPSIPHASQQFDVNTVPTTEGTQLQYSCSSGYVSNGHVTTCHPDGQWAIMICLRECPAPPVISNAVPQFDPNTAAHTEGTQLQYKCATGYVAEPEGLVTCETTGQWTAKSCLRLCPVPPSIAHSTPDFDINNPPRTEGIELVYMCDTGYSVQGQMICQTNGQWTTMTCEKECPLPTIAHANKVSIGSGPYLVGDELEYACDGSYIATDLNNKITCKTDGTWTIITCNRIQTCRDVHQCWNSYPDQDYWIYPPAFTDKRVKIYCKDLAGTPTEFVSFKNVNTGLFPFLTNINCGGEVVEKCGSDAAVGETRYSRIKVSIMTMAVDRTDTTFAVTDWGSTQLYGEANDCYSIHYSNSRASCGPKGTFNIDLTGTGLTVDTSLTFEYYGWNHWGEAVWSAGNTKIDLLCGGWGGGCKPVQDIMFKFDSSKVPDESEAVVPECHYP